MDKKLKKTFKKIISIILIVLTLFGCAIAFAISGNGQWIGAQYNSGFRTTSSTGSYGILIRRLENRSTGEKKTVFCAQHSVPFDTRRMGKR